MATKITTNKEAWGAIVAEVIKSQGVPRMRRVAAAANAADGIEDGYRVSADGAKPLNKRSFRVTVITATAEAMEKNAKHNTLVNEFYQAAGD